MNLWPYVFIKALSLFGIYTIHYRLHRILYHLIYSRCLFLGMRENFNWLSSNGDEKLVVHIKLVYNTPSNKCTTVPGYIYEIWIIHEWIAHFVYGIYVFLTYLIFEIAPFSNMWPGVGYELWSMYENPSIFSGPNHLEKVSPLNNPCEADEWVCLSVSSGMAYPLECWNVVEHFFFLQFHAQNGYINNKSAPVDLQQSLVEYFESLNSNGTSGQ